MKRSLGPPRIVNFETLGYAELLQRLLRGGTHMHLSHIGENLLAWYLNFDHARARRGDVRPGLEVPPARQTVRSGAGRRTLGRAPPRLRSDAGESGTWGRSNRRRASSATSLLGDGTLYPKGTAVPQRADFNTLDNPFAWSVDQPATA